MRTFLMASFVAAMSIPQAADARSLGKTYSCLFRKNGKIIIDTREPGASLTIKGKRHPVIGGSYFYQSERSPQVEIFFGPNARWWEYKGERSSNCRVWKNQR